MQKAHFFARVMALAGVTAVLASTSAQAATTNAPSTAGCSEPAVSQLFLSWNDLNWYAMIPGEAADNFAGTGWALSGGANIKTTTLADGKSGAVLDLPAGSKAVSPYVCVGSGMPLAKTLIRTTAGSGSVSFAPDDLTAGTQMKTMALKGGSSWSLSAPVNVLPGAISDWHIMQFTYLAGGKGSEFQIYDFGVDPRMKW